MGERYLDLIEKLVSNELLFIPKYTNLRCSSNATTMPTNGRYFMPVKDRYFTLPQAASYAPKGYFIENPLATPGNCCCCD